MQRTVEQGFRDFLTKLTPTTTESEGVKKHRASIQACLTSNFGLNRFFRIGSLGNGTSISGFSDTDYLACFPSEKLAANSTAALAKICSALGKRFFLSGVRVSCPAVVCPFGSTAAETTELVPAGFVSDQSGYSVYGIPDCRGGWMRACPDAHNAYVRYVDEKFQGKAKALVRYVKAWKYFGQVPISSFYLELAVTEYALGESSLVYGIDIAQFLFRLLNNGLADIQDPMGISGKITACKTELHRMAAMSKLKTAVLRSEKAYEAVAKGDLKRAFFLWRFLYGEKFPGYYIS